MSLCWNCVAVLVVVVAMGCAQDEETREAKCKRYRDHVVELRLGDLPAGVSEQHVKADHRAAMTSALGDDFVATCEQKLANGQLDCALASRDFAAAMQCAER